MSDHYERMELSEMMADKMDELENALQEARAVIEFYEEENRAANILGIENGAKAREWIEKWKGTNAKKED